MRSAGIYKSHDLLTYILLSADCFSMVKIFGGQYLGHHRFGHISKTLLMDEYYPWDTGSV